MGLSRVQSSKNQLHVTVRNGSFTVVVLIIYPYHVEKWGCHGSGLQNMVFLTWEMGLSRVQSSKNQLVTVRNGVVTDLGYKIWYFWREKWVCHVYRAPKTNLSRWEMGLSRIWATKYGIFDVRNGSVTCTELQKPTCHGEKWVFHGCCANNISLSRWEMGLSRIWATKYGIFDVRNGSVTCTELQKPTCHGEKWGCHGSGLQNMVFLTWEMGLSRVQSSKNQLVTVRNGVVTDLGYKIWYFWREKWVCHVYRAPKTNLSRWEMGLSRGCYANNIDLSRWEMGLSVVTDLGFKIWYFWREKWVCHVYRAPKTNFSRRETGLSRVYYEVDILFV